LFYLQYIVSELRRRRGRTFLTALGLGVGVGLVVTVSALSNGLDKAQDEVLKPLTGVGTDLSVSRPLRVKDGGGGDVQTFAPGPGGGNLSSDEQEKLRAENGGARIGLHNLGKPGERFERTDFVTTTQLSFPQSTRDDVSKLDGVKGVAAGLTVTAIDVSGRVPTETPEVRQAPGAAGPPRNIDFDSRTVTGVDQAQPSLGAITSGQIKDGRYFSGGDAREAIVNVSYARRKGLSVGETLDLGDKKFKVVGLASPPLGGQASDLYLKLDQLQSLADRKGRVNTLYVRATDADAVGGLAKRIEGSFSGSQVTTSKELADRVGGSLVDAKDLAARLGTALTVVGLIAAFLIASLLTLSSMTKRVRELGTLKALGWPQRLVVRQVTGESLAQGALGGVVGAALGIAGAAIITAIAPELQATVASASGGPGPFGQGAVVASGSRSVTLDAPVSAGLILLAVGLALFGGLLSGAVGGARAARLRPADALRHID
jgi:putative ABC transport system permease protein